MSAPQGFLMSVFFSDHYSTGISITALPATPVNPDAGIAHGRKRYRRAQVTALALTTDTIRMITMKSSDRLINLQISSDGVSAAGAVNIGAYLTGNLHDGVVLDADLFASAITTSSAIHRTAALVEAGTVQHESGGIPLWEMVVEGADPLSWTVDPQVRIDLVITPSTSFTTTASILTLEAEYTAGD